MERLPTEFIICNSNRYKFKILCVVNIRIIAQIIVRIVCDHSGFIYSSLVQTFNPHLVENAASLLKGHELLATK